MTAEDYAQIISDFALKVIIPLMALGFLVFIVLRVNKMVTTALTDVVHEVSKTQGSLRTMLASQERLVTLALERTRDQGDDMRRLTDLYKAALDLPTSAVGKLKDQYRERLSKDVTDRPPFRPGATAPLAAWDFEATDRPTDDAAQDQP